MDAEDRFVSRDEFDCGGARRELRGCLKKSRVDLKCGDPLGGLPAEIVHANCADQAYLMAQPFRVNSKVQGRSAQSAAVRENVPKYFAQGDDAPSTHYL